MGIFSFLTGKPQNQIKERRGARRQQPLFEASWRLLGDRSNTYYPAEVKDVSATGIALHLPRELALKAGTIIMVQMEGVPERFVGPWLAQVLYVETQDEVLLAGCAFSSPFKEEDCAAMLKSANGTARDGGNKRPHAREAYDPFVHGSQRDRRRTPRRRGAMLAVDLQRNDNDSCQALVLDRSLGGLALQVSQEIPDGSIVKVRPCKAPDEVPWIQILVRHCQVKGSDWILGCEFCKTPPAHVMLHFG